MMHGTINIKDTFLSISHTTNVPLFKFRCNIFIGVRIIKEMPGSVASGTLCIYLYIILFIMADMLAIVLPMLHVYVVEYSKLHEKCPPKLNVMDSFNFYCYFTFGIIIAECYYLHFRKSLFFCTDFFIY